MSEKPKPKKVPRYKPGAQLARVVQELHKEHPDNDLYALLNDILKLPQREQHNVWFAADGTTQFYKKIKRVKAGADLSKPATKK